MDFGIFNLMNRRDPSYPAEQLIRNTVEQVQAAEAAGIGTAWFTEHHFTNYSIPPSPLMMVGHVAPQTSTIRLGTAVVLPALYQPARLLGDIGFAGCLAPGRLVLGLGSGYQAHELRRFHLTLEESRAAADEWLDFISRGLGKESFGYDGAYVKMPETPFSALATPEIWIAGNSPDSQARAASGNHPLFMSGFAQDTATLKMLRNQAEETWQARGLDPASLRFATLRYCFVTDDKDAALAFAENVRFQVRLSRYLRKGQLDIPGAWLPEEPFEGEMSPEDIVAWNPIGDAETVAEKLADEIREVGSFHTALYMTMGNTPHAAAMRSIERFGSDVLPLLEREFGPRAQHAAAAAQ